MSGTLYIVATPIGNLADISQRALEILRSAAVIAVEDTRHTGRLLQAYGIATPMLAFHEFNEKQRSMAVLERVASGEDVALVSDAGTPLISDPGYALVKLAHEKGLRVVPVPGASAVIAALSAAGLPTDRFSFEGFLPSKSGARKTALAALQREARTMVFYEAPHRIVESLEDMVQCFGPEREAVLARELTKNFETLIHAPLAGLLARVRDDENQRKGEFVVVVSGFRATGEDLDEKALAALETLMEELPLKQAAALAARLTGVKKSLLYDAGLRLQGKKD